MVGSSDATRFADAGVWIRRHGGEGDQFGLDGGTQASGGDTVAAGLETRPGHEYIGLGGADLCEH